MNVLLDLDGTLTDPRDGIIRCIQHAFHCLGDRCPPDAELEDYIGPPLQTSFSTLFANDPIKTAQAIHLYRQRFSSIGIFENRVYPDVSAALAILRDLGAVLIVATSKPTVFAERIIAHFDLGEYIGSVYGSELDGTRSEKAELISHVLKAERLRPSATSMVGDRKQDMLGARANGLFAVGVLWGYGSRLELIEAGAAAVCERPTDLAYVLSSNSAFESGRAEERGAAQRERLD